MCILLCVPTQAPPYLIAAYHVYTSATAHTHTHTHTHVNGHKQMCILLCVPTQAPPYLIAAYHVYTSTSATARTHTHTHAWRYNNRECCNRYNEFSHFWDGCVRKCEELNIIQCVTKVNMSNLARTCTHVCFCELWGLSIDFYYFYTDQTIWSIPNPKPTT